VCVVVALQYISARFRSHAYSLPCYKTLLQSDVLYVVTYSLYFFLLFCLLQVAAKHLYKFGVLYVAAGQSTEQEILGNGGGSAIYEDFVNRLGRCVRLVSTSVYAPALRVQVTM
jgi:hypothetical protein